MAEGKIEVEYTGVADPQKMINIIVANTKRAMYYTDGCPPEDFSYKITVNGEVVHEYHH